MSDNQNPLQVVFKAYETFTQCIQSHLSHFIGDTHNPSPQNQRSITSISSSSKATISDGDPKLLQPKEDFAKGKSARPLTKEELGRATWTLLHTLAAQMAILSRIYPCKECADHFKEVLNSNPVQAGSHAEFSQWLCHVHNVVNRSLGKLVFPCQRVDARWGKLECEGRACDLEGSTQTLVSKQNK
ncbi:hypothetical protein HHK36_031012 [Tetracentron sinense]|uniref:Sulfhydryl oxidase n=1 Tax=Tetracentron sinense TaxID=13715 RepID=A0A834YC39_TETSI|nr:hypothetical protein HHK36_031012 [Tetracentron sinense]